MKEEQGRRALLFARLEAVEARTFFNLENQPDVEKTLV